MKEVRALATARRPRRRYMDAETGWRHAEIAAYHRFGHEHMWFVITRRYWQPIVTPLLSIVALSVLWFVIPHRVLGWSALIAAIVAVCAAGAYGSTRAGTQRRIMAAARRGGQPARSSGTGLAFAAFIAVMSLGAWLTLWGPLS